MQNHVFETEISPSEYMLRLADSGIGRTYKALALRQLQLKQGGTVLDLGCGPGADLDRYAQVVGPTGTVVGIDHDEDAVVLASQRTAELAQVHVEQGDVLALDLADASVDAVHTDRVLQHVANPAAALGEAVRVLKPGGRAVFAEPDWRTLVIDHPDTRLSETFGHYIVEHQVRNSRLGSQLPRLCRNVGLTVEAVIPVTSVFDDLDSADQVLGFQRVTQRMVERGLMKDQEGHRWLDHLSKVTVFASVTLFMVVALKPCVLKP